MIKKQSDLIQKMNVQITTMQKELESKDKLLEEKLRKCDLHWQSKLKSHTVINNNITTTEESAIIEELRSKTEQLQIVENTAESLLNENIELRSRVSHLEDSVHHLEKHIKKSKGGLKDRGSCNIINGNDTLNNNTNDNHEEEDKKHKPMDIVSKILFTPKSRSVPPSGEPTHYNYNGEQNQQVDSLNMNHRSQQQPSQMVIQMKSSSAQDVHPGVFSHSDKPVKVKPLTRIL